MEKTVNYLYSIRLDMKTGEYHLFKSNTAHLGGCVENESLSICKEVKQTDCEYAKMKCLHENEARNQCAYLGRKVCANCIGDLYRTIDK